jgi:hypothetical protein
MYIACVMSHASRLELGFAHAKAPNPFKFVPTGLNSHDDGLAKAFQDKKLPRSGDCEAVSSGAYERNGKPISTAGQVPDGSQVSPSLERLVHPERLAPLLLETNGDLRKAINLYAWSIEISAAFWGSFHMLEVSFRNALHGQLTLLAGQEDWWLKQSNLLHDFEKDEIAKAISRATRIHAQSTPGHVVAELGFAFWVGLLANGYHNSLWQNRLERAFPHFSGLRTELHFNLDRLRKLRNRIAHHEPIHDRDLRRDNELIYFILGYIEPAVAAWVDELSRIPEVLSQRSSRIDGSSKLTF